METGTVDKEYPKRVTTYANFRAGLYQIVWGQCTATLRTKPETFQEFDQAFQDGLALFGLLRKVVHTFEKRASKIYEVSRMKEIYYNFKQGQSETLHNYHKRLVAMVEAMEAVSLTLVDPCLLEQVASESGRKAAGN